MISHGITFKLKGQSENQLLLKSREKRFLYGTFFFILSGSLIVNWENVDLLNVSALGGNLLFFGLLLLCFVMMGFGRGIIFLKDEGVLKKNIFYFTFNIFHQDEVRFDEISSVVIQKITLLKRKSKPDKALYKIYLTVNDRLSFLDESTHYNEVSAMGNVISSFIGVSLLEENI